MSFVNKKQEYHILNGSVIVFKAVNVFSNVLLIDRLD